MRVIILYTCVSMMLGAFSPRGVYKVTRDICIVRCRAPPMFGIDNQTAYVRLCLLIENSREGNALLTKAAQNECLLHIVHAFAFLNIYASLKSHS